MTFASDDFTGTQGTELSVYNSDWVEHPSYSVDFNITSLGDIVGASANTACYYYNTAPGSTDYSVEVDWRLTGVSSPASGVAARLSSSANTMYLFRQNQVNGALELYKVSAGTFSLLGSTANTDISGTLKIEVQGTSPASIDCFINGSGTASISTTDSTITAAGFAGLRMNNANGGAFDNFSAALLGGGATVTLSSPTANATGSTTATVGCQVTYT